ncbi:hypothetical protein PF005_g24364 [Phytophthora fragariae]|uniref:Uncharacterized protein n=1 Tax=Phytophthora fragariae TaxID=53985 RepID=A0A6A3W2U6_9STRA|nr:hypothetical protein PF005_g24364 [Phytophthora fragariae]
MDTRQLPPLGAKVPSVAVPKGGGVAVARGELGLVKWLFAHFSGCFVPVLVVEDAASSGRLEILKFLLEHDAGRNCTHMRVKTPIGGENVVHWSSRSIVNAIEKGHKDIAKWLYQQVPHESSTDDIQMIVESSLAAGYIDLANLVLPPDRNILECAPFCPRPEIVEMALETAYFPLNKSASNQQTLVGFLSGPDDKIAVEWAVQQNPNYAMLLPVNDEPVATIHR